MNVNFISWIAFEFLSTCVKFDSGLISFYSFSATRVGGVENEDVAGEPVLEEHGRQDQLRLLRRLQDEGL